MIFNSNLAFYRYLFDEVRNMWPFTYSVNIIDCVVCQMCLESDFGRSDLARLNHNLCGMKVPKKRLTVCLDPKDSSGFASYKSDRLCIFDFFLWLTYHNFDPSTMIGPHEYTDFLFLHSYCLDEGYSQSIIDLYSKYHTKI